jgi:hypothetical protein
VEELMKEKLHFSANLKSFLSEFPFLSSGDSVTFDPKKVKPKGNRYFIRKEVSLTPEDWVIFGVASTDDVDLVDDVIDAEAVFGAHLEEFVNTGRIFWEHGYKMAGKSDPETMIDIPLGIPYLAEIHDNKLWIYILLDKTHPQSKKVWKKINGADDRFRGQLGLSIGALPQGKPTTVKHPTKGIIKKSPPMKLYEVSITGQPINPFTWAQVVKSFINDQDGNDKINTSNVKAASMFDAAKMEESMAQPMNNMQDPMAADPMAAMGGADPMAAMGGGDPMAADPMAAMGGEDPMAAGGAEGDMGGEEGSESLADLFGEEDSELGDNETGDSAINLLMDKIDMALEQIGELKQSIESSGVGGSSLNREDDVNLPEAPEGAEPTEDAPQMEEEPMTDIKKSVQETLDKQDMLLGLVKSLTSMMVEQNKALSEQKKVNKSLSDQLYNISEELEVFKTVAQKNYAKPAKVETIDERRKSFDPATTKSFSSQTVGSHPGFNQIESDMSSDDKLKSILRDKGKTEILAELIGVYKSFSGQPNQVARKHEEIFGAAKDHLGLSKGAFKEIVNKID